MIAIVFIILVGLEAWTRPRAAYPFLALLILTGVMVKDNLIQMTIFWQGVTWAGYLAFSPHSSKTGVPIGGEPQPSAGNRTLNWGILLQIGADLILIFMALLLSIQPGAPNLAQLYTSPSTLWPATAPRWLFFGLWAAIPILKTGAFASIQRQRLFAPSDNAYAWSFWLSSSLVSIYQIVHLGRVCFPTIQTLSGTASLVASVLILIYGLPKATCRWDSAWRRQPRPTLPPMDQIITTWDTKLSLGAINLGVSTLVLLGTACMEFETGCLRFGNNLSRLLLDAARAAKQLCRPKK